MRLTSSSAVDALNQGCGEPDCDCKGGPLAIHPQCHKDVPTWVVLTFDENGNPRCTVYCAECDEPVTEIVLGEDH